MRANNLHGIIYKLLNCLFFALMSMVIATHLQGMPPQQILFLRALASVLICLLVIKAMKIKLKLPTQGQKLKLYFWRALINLLAMAVWVEGLKRMHINDATALAYLGPVWILLIAPIIFAEKTTWQRILIIIFNLLGVVVILQPRWVDINPLGLALILLSTLLWALYEVICKKQAATEHYILQALFNFILCLILTAPAAYLTWQPLTQPQYLFSGLLAALGVANVIVLFLAYVHSPLIVLAPFSYSRLLFTIILSFCFFKTLPTFGCLLGAFIIIATNIYAARMELISKYTHET